MSDSGATSYYDDEPTSSFLDPLLHDPVGTLVRRWKPMSAVAALVLLVTIILAVRVEPLFSAKTTVSVLGARISENFVQTTVEIGTLDQINAIISEVLSRKNLARIVLAHEASELGDSEEALERVVENARTRIEILSEAETGRSWSRRRESSRVYSLSFKDGDPERAAAVANDLATSFIDVHLRLRSSEARVTTDFLRRELAQVEEELRTQERLSTKFKQQYRGELPGELGSNIARMDRLQETRRVLVEQLRLLESRTGTSQRFAANDSPEKRLAVLRARLHESLSLYTIDHPNVVALQRQVDVLEHELGLVNGEEPSLLQNDAGALRRRIAQVEYDLSKLDTRVARTPERQEEQDAIDRRLVILRDSYSDLMRKVDQAELSESVESAQHGVRVSILDRAVPPTDRDGSRVRVLLLGILTLLGSVTLLALLLEHFDAVIVSSEQIEPQFSLPVIGSVPHIS
jgi:uncharacterized protein involved in exopolysaccharide biosynthesis